jgi:transcription elongation factor GreB
MPSATRIVLMKSAHGIQASGVFETSLVTPARAPPPRTPRAYTDAVSKAFKKEDGPSPDDADAPPPRTTRSPITPAGLARLQQELADLTRGSVSDLGQRRARVIVQVLESIYVVEPSAPDGRVAFGARITMEDASGRETAYEIVGPDEVDVVSGRISIASPVGQALVGKRAGDAVVLRRPKGNLEVTVVSVTLPAS